MDELKPCPLCGSEDIERRVTASSAKIRCRECGVGISRAYFGEYGSRAEAEKGIGTIVTKLWNKRAADAVEVVRCKDCIHRVEGTWAKCTGRRPEEFCSDGERKFHGKS